MTRDALVRLHDRGATVAELPALLPAADPQVTRRENSLSAEGVEGR
jgi:hypothetical protein